MSDGLLLKASSNARVSLTEITKRESSKRVWIINVQRKLQKYVGNILSEPTTDVRYLFFFVKASMVETEQMAL